MKKILAILLIPFLFFVCYLIYILTDKHSKSYLFMGDGLLKYFSEMGNTCYVDDDYRINDLLSILKHNDINCNISLHLLLNRSNFLTISIGNNDIMSDLVDDKDIFYSELNEYLNKLRELLDIISNYDFNKVFFLGFYKFDNKNSDYVHYLNYNVRKIVNKYGYEFIDINTQISPFMIKNNGNYMLNDMGYFKLNKILVEKYKNT